MESLQLSLVGNLRKNSSLNRIKDNNVSFGISSNAFIKDTKEEKSQLDYDVYNFQDSGSGKSWLIGTGVYDGYSQYANAFKDGIAGCPEDLQIPGSLTDSSGNTKPVEIIGPGGFIRCGDKSSNGKTKRLKVPRQVKIIKYAGLADMNDVEIFEIEAGSELEAIDDYGLYCIGRNLVLNDASERTATLILPSTLSYVFQDGIYWCNLFQTIVYCGSHILLNSTDLEANVVDTVLKVTSQYPANTNMFNRVLKRDSQTEAEAERICENFTAKPTIPLAPTHFTPCFPLKHSFLPFIINATSLLPSHSIFSPSLNTFSTSLSFFIHFA